MPSQFLQSFVERQRATALADLQGLVLKGQIPLPLRALSQALAGMLQDNAYVESLELSCNQPNFLILDVRSSLPIFEVPGIDWVVRDLFGFDLTAGRLRLEFEIVPRTFSWPYSPFLVLQLPSQFSGSTLSLVLKSSGLLRRLLGDWTDAVIIEGRELVLDLRWILEKTGWSCLGSAIEALEIEATGEALWIQCALQVHSSIGIGPATPTLPPLPATQPIQGAELNTMKDLFEKYLANGLTDFEGLHVSGAIPLREETLNELLTALLESAAPATEATATAESMAGPDLGALLQHVKQAQVKLEQGVLTLRFVLNVESKS